ncbi:unnamed protein product, partial [Amoebophrya sp. A25]
DNGAAPQIVDGGEANGPREGVVAPEHVNLDISTMRRSARPPLAESQQHQGLSSNMAGGGQMNSSTAHSLSENIFHRSRANGAFRSDDASGLTAGFQNTFVSASTSLVIPDAIRERWTLQSNSAHQDPRLVVIEDHAKANNMTTIAAGDGKQMLGVATSSATAT